MARVKQTAHESTGRKPPRLHLATKAAQASAQKAIAMRKSYPFCPGMVAARKIRKFQKTTNLLIRKSFFQHLLVCKLALKFGKSELQMQSTSVLALQEAAEYFMVDVFNNVRGAWQARHHQGQGSGSSLSHPRDWHG